MKKIYIKPIVMTLASRLEAQMAGTSGEAGSIGEDSSGNPYSNLNNGESAEDGEDAGAKRRSLWDSDDE